MILSESEEAVGHWWSSEGDEGEPRHHRGEIVAPVEAVFEFGEVAGHMLVTNGTVGARDGAFDVSEGRVDPLKGGHQGGAAATCRHRYPAATVAKGTLTLSAPLPPRPHPTRCRPRGAVRPAAIRCSGRVM